MKSEMEVLSLIHIYTGPHNHAPDHSRIEFHARNLHPVLLVSDQ